ncbi:MAG: SDR family oxidoreductase [Treponema sp.]|nr:SDR family oxidoreductase [Treponema sp.]
MTALITGASGGIGAELARLFAGDGYNLILVARRLEKLDELKSELESAFGISVTNFAQDLSEAQSAKNVFDFTKSQNLSVDVLVNNAGFGDFALFAESNLQKQQQMIQLNITTLTELTHYFIPQMIERKCGRILNVASLASFMPGPKMSVYYASKAFVRSFSEALSVELKSSGITVTALCPGPVTTDFWDRAEAGSSSLFSHFMFADSKKVARYGYKRLMKGKVLAIPYFSTRCAVFFTRLLPRSLVRNLIYLVQK